MRRLYGKWAEKNLSVTNLSTNHTNIHNDNMDEKKIIKNIKRVTYFDPSYYRIEFLDNSVRNYLATTKWLDLLPKPGLAYWRELVGTEQADHIRDHAALSGRRVHHAAYLHLGGGYVLYEPYPWLNPEPELVERNRFIISQLRAENIKYLVLNEQDEMIKFQRFVGGMKILQPELLAYEVNVYSVEDEGAGTADMFLRIKSGEYPLAGSKKIWIPGGIGVWDIKTGRLNKANFMQTGTYRKFALHSSLPFIQNEPITHTGIFHLDAETTVGIEGFRVHVRTADEAEEDYKDSIIIKKAWHTANPNWEPIVREFDTVVAPYGTNNIPHGFTAQDKKLAEQLQQSLALQGEKNDKKQTLQSIGGRAGKDNVGKKN